MRGHPNSLRRMRSRYVVGLSTPSSKKNIDGWDSIKNKECGRIVLTLKESWPHNYDCKDCYNSRKRCLCAVKSRTQIK